MKKVSLLMVGAAIAVLMSSCNKKDDELTNAQDSISYAYAVGYGSHISEQYLNGESEGPNYDAMMKGIKEAIDNDDTTLNAYVIGLQIGADLKQSIDKGLMGDSTLKLNGKIVKNAIKKAMKKEDMKMTADQAGQILQELVRKQMEQSADKKYGQYKKQQEAFLTQNGKRSGVKTTASGLQYEIITEGSGAKATESDMASVNYKGTLTDGTEFDSSAKHGDKPAEMPVATLIAGWKEALQMMPVGSKWKIYIPSNLAYGSADMGAIKPYSTLIFDVELVSVKPAPQQQQMPQQPMQ